MAHPEQIDFCKFVRDRYPEKFEHVDVLDIGSLDINGNNRYLFTDYTYTGIDVGKGKNVDVVTRAHKYKPKKQFDVVISTECFEHDMHWRDSLQNATALTKPGGIFLFTCATTGRQEHGTRATTPKDSPAHKFFKNYYHNLTSEEIEDAIDIPGIFSEWHFGINNDTKDLYFYGIKRN